MPTSILRKDEQRLLSDESAQIVEVLPGGIPVETRPSGFRVVRATHPT